MRKSVGQRIPEKEIANLQFIRIFINIETNDITEARYEDKWLSHLMDNFCKIIETTKDSIPDVENINEKVA